MKCGVCHTPLTVVGYRTREYRDDVTNRIYKTRRCPRYAPCRGLNDPQAHPARHRTKLAPVTPADQRAEQAEDDRR